MNSTTTRKARAGAHAFLGTSNSIWEDNLEQGVGFLAFNKMQTFFLISPGMSLTWLLPVDFLTSKKGFAQVAVFFLCGVLLLCPANYFAKPVVTSYFWELCSQLQVGLKAINGFSSYYEGWRVTTHTGHEAEASFPLEIIWKSERHSQNLGRTFQ